jgi:hypothetical protein
MRRPSLAEDPAVMAEVLGVRDEEEAEAEADEDVVEELEANARQEQQAAGHQSADAGLANAPSGVAGSSSMASVAGRSAEEEDDGSGAPNRRKSLSSQDALAKVRGETCAWRARAARAARSHIACALRAASRRRGRRAA